MRVGQYLCDAPVVDLVRAMATKSSWSAIAHAINEMRTATWQREVEIPFRDLCERFNVNPKSVGRHSAKSFQVSAHCIKNMYMQDFWNREPQINKDFEAELGDDILKVDWTHGAATRCRGKHLLNILDGKSRILISQLTPNAKPQASSEAMHILLQRGVQPKVVYVDDQ